MTQTNDYSPLTIDSLAERLHGVDAVQSRVGKNRNTWSVREVGDGNLNLVFIVEGPSGGVVVKQALPYVRLVGDSWPLPLRRSYFEYHALTRQAQRDPGRVPEIYHFDEIQALIVMEFLQPHHILRHSLIAGTRHDGLAQTLGLFCARTLFRGSDLSMTAADRKHDVALFAENVELCDITENLVFDDPYYAAEMNRHTSPQLDSIVAQLRADIDLKVEVQHLKARFCTNAETLLHGDLHTGSIMVNKNESAVIDPEFALYGPVGFDVGMLLANFFMAYFAQSGHGSDRQEYQQWILGVIENIWSAFTLEFSRLWREERTGILYQHSLFEDQQHHIAAEQALIHRLDEIWCDTVGFAGVEMHRRTLGLAHIIELDNIENPDKRAACEKRGLWMGRQCIVNRTRFRTMSQLLELAQSIERGLIT